MIIETYITITAFVFVNLVSAHSEWGYPKTDASEEFPKWGGLCDNGVYQSPIDLSLNGAFKSDFKQLKFDNYNQKQEKILMVNNGHSVQLYSFPNKMKLRGGPLTDEYIVEQLHFHWWSEHTIDKIRYPLECHIVHRNLRYRNVSEAIKHKDGLAVVGILYHISNQPNEAVGDILHYIDEVKSYEHLNKPVEVKQFTVSELLPEFDGYFTYAGSLTTPACAEVVTWIVMHQTFPVTLKQVDKFKEVEHDKGKHLENNYRAVQKTHNRAVVAVLYSKAVALHMSLGVILLIALSFILQ